MQISSEGKIIHTFSQTADDKKIDKKIKEQDRRNGATPTSSRSNFMRSQLGWHAIRLGGWAVWWQLFLLYCWESTCRKEHYSEIRLNLKGKCTYLLFIFLIYLLFSPSKASPWPWESSLHGPSHELDCATAQGCPVKCSCTFLKENKNTLE